MLDTRALFRRSYPSGARQLFVSGAGSNANNGLTAGSPKRTLQAAVDLAQAGDRIVVAAGTYDNALFYGKQGTATSWITVEAAPGASPVIDVSASPTSYNASLLNNGLDVQQSTYVAVYGLEIHGLQTSTDTNPSGVTIFRGSHHVAVWCCDIHDFPGGGVNCFYIGSSTNPSDGSTLPAGGWDAVDVFFNRIHGLSRFNPYNTSGVSFYGAENLTELLDGRYGYRAVGNHIYDVVCTVPYTPGGFTEVTDGNGISPDSLAVANSLYPALVPYLKRGLIEGNVIAACGGRGVHIYNSLNVDVVHNTLIGNLRTNSSYINGSTEADVALDSGAAAVVTANSGNGCVIAGNVLLPLNTTKTIDLVAATVTANVILGGTDTVTAGNADARATGTGWFRTMPTAAALAAGMTPEQLAPATVGAVARRAGTLGYTPLGGRATAAWTAGASEPFVPARAFRNA